MSVKFKELSVVKKILVVFLCIILFIVASVVFIFGFNYINKYNDFEVFNTNTKNSYTTNSELSSIDSNTGNFNTTSDIATKNDIDYYSKDVSFDIETKNILKEVEDVVNYVEKYDAIYESSYAGDTGYGYIDLKIPKKNLDKFIKDFKEKYNVISYNYDVQNETQNYKDVEKEKIRLQDKLKYLQDEIKLVDDSEASIIREEIIEIKDRLWELDNNKEDINNNIVYSDVYISINNPYYTSYNIFNDSIRAIKTGARIFILGIIYGLYFTLYVFCMIWLIKKIKLYLSASIKKYKKLKNTKLEKLS